MIRPVHPETHRVQRIGWLRAAVMGANDGIVSTASLIVGVGAAGTGRGDVLLAGLAGLVAGAMSMAAGEYVSVSSQADAERADLARERRELADAPGAELEELAGIYEARGLDPDLARRVAVQLTERDALAAHARDELGISEIVTARPVQAAVVSALTFAAGAVVPLAVVLLAPAGWIPLTVAAATLLTLVVLGALGALAGGCGRRARDAARGLLGRAGHGGDRPYRRAVRGGRGLNRRGRMRGAGQRRPDSARASARMRMASTAALAMLKTTATGHRPRTRGATAISATTTA